MTEPVLDNHCHLDDRHRGIEAVEAFARSGGTHLLVVNQPSWKHGVDVDDPGDFRAVFDRTIALVERASEVLPGRAWPVLGVHPALLSRLIDRGSTPAEAATLMQGGLDIAAEYAADGATVALKSGRPHYSVPDPVWDESNAVIRHALDLAAETGVAVQLHTEATKALEDVAGWAQDAGLPPDRVVKHYAGGRCAGVIPSVIARKDPLQTAAERGEPFLMETDFLDDPERPGAVLGPKTVPRRTEWLRSEGFETAVTTAHVTTPERVYGIDTVASL